jgi:hypothetical protein
MHTTGRFASVRQCHPSRVFPDAAEVLVGATKTLKQQPDQRRDETETDDPCDQ